MTLVKALSNLISNILLIVSACLVIFAIGETGVRTYTTMNTEGGSFFRENRFISPWFTSYDAPPPHFDDSGNAYFRHRTVPVSQTKSEALVRIVAVGGSTTANERPFAIDGRDYAKALEARLNAASIGPRYEVLNAGGDAFSTAHSLVNIVFRLLEFSPDAIILMHNINDLSANYFQDGAGPDYANKYLREYYLNPQLQGSLSVRGLLVQSRMLALFGMGWLPRGAINIENDITAGLGYFARNLTMISAICKQSGVDLIFLSQPNSFSFPNNSYKKEDFLKYNEKVKEIAAQTNTAFIDMHRKFGHSQEFFLDAFHFSPRGISRFSEILFDELKSIL